MSAAAHHLTRSERATQGLHRIAEALAPSGNIKAKVRTVHARTGLPYSRTRELWYGRAKRVDESELARIEAAIPRHTVEFSLAYVRSIENRVAALLEELVEVRACCEAELAARGGDAAPVAGCRGQPRGTPATDGGGDAAHRP